MKWHPISELDTDVRMLFRIETDEDDVVYMEGYLEDGGLLYVIGYTGTVINFNYRFLCGIDQPQRYGIKSIHFIDPKEIEL